jgi:hypothetical protein
MYILTDSRFKKNVAKFDFFSFFSRMQFSTLINYSANICWTSYEPTVVIDEPVEFEE